MYVMLSRVPSREAIMLLRSFRDDLIILWRYLRFYRLAIKLNRPRTYVPRPERTRSLPDADVSETWPGETRDTDSAVTSDSKTDTSTQHLMV